MQSALLCLTTLICLAVTLEWSPNCSGEIEKSLQIKPPDCSAETSLERELTLRISGDELLLAKNRTLQVYQLLRAEEKSTAAGATSATEQERFATKIEATLPEIARLTILHHFGADENESLKSATLDDLAKRFFVKKEHQKNAGLFVTLIKNGDTRACWGNVAATHRNLVESTVYTTEDALNKDYRFSKIKRSEINLLIPQVTVVKRIVPINSISTMQPLKQGLMVRAGGKGAVLLPGEASDPHYQLVKTKLKAGIPASQQCQLYRIEADVYR
jgi:AMMECR1 domain-containing protein